MTRSKLKCEVSFFVALMLQEIVPGRFFFGEKTKTLHFSSVVKIYPESLSHWRGG